MTTALSSAERAEMLQVISDLSKDAYGFRLRLDYAAMSDAELTQTWDRFIVDMRDNDAAELAAEQHASARLTARLASLQADNGISAADALRWLMDAQGTDDWGYFLWDMGLGCGDVARAFSTAVGRPYRAY